MFMRNIFVSICLTDSIFVRDLHARQATGVSNDCIDEGALLVIFIF